MSELLLKNLSIDIQQKLDEKQTPDGTIAVYQTIPFGLILTLNGHILVSEHDSFFYHEMMTHPALFTHPQPQKIAIIGNTSGIAKEALKHKNIQEIHCVDSNKHLQDAINQYFPHTLATDDTRVKHHTATSHAWLSECEPDQYDVIILSEQHDDFLEADLSNCFKALKSDGILIQPCSASLLHLKTLKPFHQKIQQTKFTDWQMLNFPQPSHPSGWRVLMMTTKRPAFKRLREKDIFNRAFTTRYYNFDIHKAALVLPEFLREELELV